MNRKLPKGTRHIECLVPFGELPEGYMINYVNYPRKPNTFKRTITINNGITTTVRALSNLLNLWSVFLYNSFSYPFKSPDFRNENTGK